MRAASELGAFFQPGFEILWRIHYERAFHSIMAQTTQLRANHLVGPGFDGSEPDRNQRTGDCIATDPHAWQKEIVDHIL